MASHLPSRQGLGKDIGSHVVCGAVCDVDGTTGNDLANEMVSDVDVFSAGMIVVIGCQLERGLVVAVQCRS